MSIRITTRRLAGPSLELRHIDVALGLAPMGQRAAIISLPLDRMTSMNFQSADVLDQLISDLEEARTYLKGSE